MMVSLIKSAFILAALTSPAKKAPGVTFDRVYELKAGEGVFAYSRISPDGRYLAYASETSAEQRNGHPQVIVVVDLKTKKTIFTEPGMDAYFSPDGNRFIYLQWPKNVVSIRDQRTGEIIRGVAPRNDGGYYSWATRDGRDLILTIIGKYYYLDSNFKAVDAAQVPPCPGLGGADRPLISHDGMRITTFVRGTVVVRDLTDCNFTFDTGIAGAKTDFSWDGRYLATHAPRLLRKGYDILVVDMQDKTVRNVTANLPGSSFYPSWTRDGRLSFRYDGNDYHGFISASNVLSVASTPLPTRPEKLKKDRRWTELFPETTRPASTFSIALVYGTWSAHTPIALAEMQKTQRYIDANRLDVSIVTATDAVSREADIVRMRRNDNITLRRIPLAASRAPLTEITNQTPSTLLFRDGVLIDRKLGAQTFEEMRDWLSIAGVKPRQ